MRQLKEAGLLNKNIALDTSITTYHSYAGRILSEHAIRLGIDATSDPLGDAALWQLASDVVRNWPNEEFTNESAVTTVIDDVIGLTKLILEHQVTFDDIRREDEKTAPPRRLTGEVSGGTRCWRETRPRARLIRHHDSKG